MKDFSCVYWYNKEERECGQLYGWHDFDWSSLEAHAWVTGRTRPEMRDILGEWGTTCEFPQCTKEATQMAHIASIGMGGRKSADRLYNVMRVCDDHALVTDGLPPVGQGMEAFYAEVGKIPGVDASAHLDWHAVRTKLRTAVLETRGDTAYWKI
jgi:hypothetical protein